MRGLRGKVALVTGAGGGIGGALSRRLAEERCVVGILDRDREAAEATARALGEAGGTAHVAAAGGTAHVAAADITDYGAVTAALAGFEAAAGPLSISWSTTRAGTDLCRSSIANPGFGTRSLP